MTTTEAVKAFLANEEWKYAEKQGWFETGVRLKDDIGIMLQINTNDAGLLVLSALDREIPEEQDTPVLLYANAMNLLFPMGCMYLDMEERVLVIRNSSVLEEITVTENTVAELVYLCIDLWSAAADALEGLLDGTLSPYEAAAQTFDAFGKE